MVEHGAAAAWQTQVCAEQYTWWGGRTRSTPSHMVPLGVQNTGMNRQETNGDKQKSPDPELDTQSYENIEAVQHVAGTCSSPATAHSSGHTQGLPAGTDHQ